MSTRTYQRRTYSTVPMLTRAQAKAAEQSARRQTALSIRRVPAPPPDLTYADFMEAERQAMARPQNSRFQPGSAKEIKCFDVALTDTAAGITWALGAAAFAEPSAAFTGITELNNILQGAGVYERIGVKILMKNIRIRGMLYAHQTTDLCYVRLSVVYDRQPNGAAAAITDIFQDSNGAAATNIDSGVNITNKNRFTVLRDQCITFDPAHSLSCGIDWFIPCRLQTEYKASGVTIGNISTGSILLIAAAINASGYVNFTNFRSRIRYED